MPLDPWLVARLETIRDTPEFSVLDDQWELPAEWDEDPGPWTAPTDVETVDRFIAGPHGAVPVRVYRTSANAMGVLIWLHGGGFVSGDLDFPEAHVVSAELSHRTGFDVVSVDYRLANDGVQFPVPVDDALAVVQWARAEYGPAKAMALGGASAGTTLSVSIAMRLREQNSKQPDGILLAYPFLHFPIPELDSNLRAELDGLPTVLRLGPAVVEAIVENYVGRTDDLPPLAVPGDQSLTALAPMWIIVSEYDDFRPSGELFAKQLREQGGESWLYLAEGMLHGHLNRLPSLSEVDRSLEFFAAALRTIHARHND